MFQFNLSFLNEGNVPVAEELLGGEAQAPELAVQHLQQGVPRLEMVLLGHRTAQDAVALNHDHVVLDVFPDAEVLEEEGELGTQVLGALAGGLSAH